MTTTMPRIVVVGLGPAGEDLLTGAATRAIEDHPVRFLRTVRHPAATAVSGAASFDEVYERAGSIDEVYTTIVDRLVDAAGHHGTVVYAVPGSPVVAERTVDLLVAHPGVAVEVVPALSFVDLAWVRLGVDPVAVGARIVDGHRIDTELGLTTGAVLVAQCDRPDVVSAVKLVVGDAIERAGVPGDDVELVVLQHLGSPGERVDAVVWHQLDRIETDHLTSVWIPPLGVTIGSVLERVNDVVVTLRRQCPWDREQTHGSLRPHLLEEAHEVLEVLDEIAAAEAAGTGDGAGDGARDLADTFGHLAEELGDLMFQVLLHAAVAAEAGWFTLNDVAEDLHDKLRARHPHVFGDVTATTADEVARRWEQEKKVEKGRDSVFDGIPAGLPALARAAKVLRRADTLGVEVPEPGVGAPSGVPGWAPGSDTGAAPQSRPEVFGEALLGLVNAARTAGVDPEAALRAATQNYVETVRNIEQRSVAGP